MTNRFQELYRTPANLYLEGSPVIIEAAVLQKDTARDKILAQIKMKNLSPKHIIACKIDIHASEINGNELESVNNFTYLDINVAQGENFGAKVPIFLPDEITRRISVEVKEIVFADHDVWNSSNSDWTPIPPQSYIQKKIVNKDIVKQYEIEMGGNCSFYPEINNGLFFCTCGTINLNSGGQCYNCGRAYSDIIRKLDVKTLKQNCEERLAKEKNEREEAERKNALLVEQKKARQKNFRKNVIVTTLIVTMLALIMCTVTIGIPYYNNEVVPQKILASAIEDMGNGNYHSAADKLEQIRDFRNAKDYILQCRYQIAMELFDAKEYEESGKIFESLAEYENSKEMLSEIAKINSYNEACKLMDEGKYYDCYMVFSRIEDYSDSKNKIEECRRLMIQNAQAGDIILFGKYYSDGNTETTEPLEWIVLDVENDNLLLLSKECVDRKPFYERFDYRTYYTPCDWKHSFIRKWLNEYFYSFFSEDEQQMILESDVDNSYKETQEKTLSESISYVGTENTIDKVFLLDAQEFVKYLSGNELAINKYRGWELNIGIWCRKPSIIVYHSYYKDYTEYTVMHMGGNYDRTYIAPTESLGIRPAMRISKIYK